MKRLIFLLVAVMGLFFTITAHPITRETAKDIASKFMETNDLHLVSIYKTDRNDTAFFVFNTTDGFVIVSADDCETPIIGYSHESRFDPENVPAQMQGFLQDFVKRIQYGIENQIVANNKTANQWELAKTHKRHYDSKAAQAIPPMLTDYWHQGCLYNTLCPELDGPCGHAKVGCVAMAMGQIMHYHNYPAIGWGSTSYYNLESLISANFGNTTYDWANMTDSLTDTSSQAQINAVATLLFHCGAAVKMRYSADNSLAITTDIPVAMLRYFNYSRQVRLERRDQYDEDAWAALLKDQLDRHQPVLYIGSGTESHAFVCDGYDDNGLFHFNWGWGGTGNGYFALNNLNPNGNDFNNGNSAIVDIIPQYDPCHIEASVFPLEAGIVQGVGDYHIGEQCTLQARPAENALFKYWKKDGNFMQASPIHRFTVVDNTAGFEAVFSFMDINQITASPTNDGDGQHESCVSLTWDYPDPEWNIIKQFENLGHQKSVVTDGTYIYTYRNNSSDTLPYFGKYTMDGELLEMFDIDGCRPTGMTFDGTYFYYFSDKEVYNLNYLYRLDLANKTVIDSTYLGGPYYLLSYDSDQDAFWCCPSIAQKLTLINRQGEILYIGPMMQTSTYGIIDGIDYFVAKDGNPHLIICSSGFIDYDITENALSYINTSLGGIHDGTTIGKYNGKDALFVVVNTYSMGSYVVIIEIKNQFAQVLGYRTYRSDNEGNTITLANELSGSSYIDSTWTELSPGLYRYGIRSVFANGTESETIWTDYIEKKGYGLPENEQEMEPKVVKTIENGQIVIIRDGRRYNLLGQPVKPTKLF